MFLQADRFPREKHLGQAGDTGCAGRDDRIQAAGEKNEISCANGAELRDNDFNLGGLAIWDGIGRMDGKDQFEAEAIAAVSEPEYFALQKLLNRTLYGPPISCYEVPRSGKVPRSGMQSAYTIVSWPSMAVTETIN